MVISSMSGSAHHSCAAMLIFEVTIPGAWTKQGANGNSA
jgi:hypothetical protein